MADRNHLALDVASALASGYDDDDFPAVQPDAHGEMTMFELHHPAGLMTMPADPTADGVGQTMIYGYKGPDGFAWLLNDPRIQGKLPRLKPNESYLYGPLGNGVRCHADGTISTFTTDQSPDQKSVFWQVRPNAFRQIAPWGSIQFDANGWHLKHVSQARIDLGAIDGLPAPLDALSSYITLSAATINLQATLLALGSASGASDPPAKSTPLLAALGAISTALGAIQTTLAALVGTGTGPGAPAAITASATAVGAAETAIAAGQITIPATGVTVA